MSSPTIPTEICEQVIDLIADTQTKGWRGPIMPQDLFSCALVSRSWLPRCRFHMFHVVFLNDAHRSQSFLNVLSSSPTVGQFVWRLVIRGIWMEIWITHLHILASHLTGLRQLEYVNISSLPDEFYNSHSHLATVKSLTLRDIMFEISFGNVIRLLGELPALDELILDYCWWGSQYEPLDAMKQKKLNVLRIQPSMRGGYLRDVLEWGLASCSVAELVSLSCPVDTDMSAVDRVLSACPLTLQSVAFGTFGPLSGNSDKRSKCLPLLTKHSYLQRLSVGTASFNLESLFYLANWLSLNTSKTFKVFRLEIDQSFLYIFTLDFISGWNIVDTTLSSVAFAALRRVEIRTTFGEVPGLRQSREWIKRALPNLYQQGNIWVSISGGSENAEYVHVSPSSDSEEDIP